MKVILRPPVPGVRILCRKKEKPNHDNSITRGTFGINLPQNENISSAEFSKN